MPTDLDELFTALGAHADRVPLGTAENARHRGRRQRQRLIATCAALAVLSAAAAIGAISLRPRATPPAEPGPLATVSFIPLQPAGSIPMDLSEFSASPTDVAVVQVEGEVAYVAGRDGSGVVHLGAMRLDTGAPVFPTVDIGQWGEVTGLYFYPAGLMVIAVPAGGRQTMIILDPTQGTVRWQRTIEPDSQAVVQDRAILIAPSSAPGLTALDWRTGEELWTRPTDATRGLLPVHPADISLPAPAGDSFPMAAGKAMSDDSRVLAVSSDAVEIIDVQTGAPLAQKTIGEFGYVFAVENSLYVGRGESELWAYPLDHDGEPTRLRSDAGWARPCGTGLLCAIRSTDGRGLVFDATSGATRAVLRPNRSGSAAGDRILSTDGVLHDADGAVLTLGATHTTAWWLTPGSILTLDDRYRNSADPTRAIIGGMAADDGTWQELGSIPTLNDWLACGVSTTHIVCAAADGFHSWRFAAE